LDIIELAKLVSGIDVGKLLFSIYEEKRTQDFIIGLNTREQLFINREDSEGRDLGEIAGGYSPVTEELNEGITFHYQGESNKKVAGESPFLFDKGIFFDSFTAKPVNGGFIIDANPMREDTNLFTEYGINIVGLTNESTELLQNFLLEAMAERIQAKIDKLL